MKLLRILSTLLMAALFLMLMLVIAIQADSPQATSLTAALPIKNLMADPLEESGPMPDLIVESFTLVPANPYTDEPAQMTARVRNIGTADAPGIRLYLYINPQEQPPTSMTSETVPLLYGIPVSPGESITLEYANFTFTEPGCQNILYAWVDPLELIDESDETNNLREIPVCVENEVLNEPDQYENDNLCDENGMNGIATDGTVQVHNFIPPDSEVDVDWVRFDAMQGKRYTIIAAGTGEDAWPILSLGDSCELEGSFGTTSRLSFVARSDGWHYVKVANNNLEGDSVERSYYEFSVREELAGLVPNITAIEPPSGFADLQTNLIITGTDFIFPPEGEICPYEDGICSPSYECAQLLNTSWVSYQQLLAIVPPNLEPGDYCITVTNPEGQTDVLTNTFTILPSKGSTPTPTATPGPIHLPLVLRQEPPPPTQVLTPTPTNTPTATPMPPITNGDFETGSLKSWARGGELPQNITNQEKHSGQFAALLGNPQLGNGSEGNIPAGKAYMEQQIKVPSDGAPQLSFWYNLFSYDVLIGEGSGQLWDSFDVTINGNSEPIFRTGNPAKVLEPNYPRYNSNWQPHTIDLSAYRGQTITIRFAVWNREYDGNGQDYANTWIYVDDVMVIR